MADDTPPDVFDVIVIGAGFAGLGAAGILREKGVRYIVLEARERIGGRVCTAGADSATPGVDLGASWITGEVDNSLLDLARRNGVVLSLSLTHDMTLYTRDGRLSDDAAVRVCRFYDEAVAHAAAVPADPLVSLAALLDGAAAALGHSEHDAATTRAYAGAMIGTVYASELGALCGPYYDEPRSEGGEHLVDAGFEAVLRCAARDAGGSSAIRLGCAVARIEHISAHGCVNVITADGGRLLARAVICTVPLGVLQASVAANASATPAFDPPLPDRTTAAILRLGMGNLEKLVTVFATDPVPDAKPCFGFLDLDSAPATGGPCPGSYFTKRAMADGSTAIIALCRGDASAAVSNLSEGDARAACLGQLELMLARPLPPCTAFVRTAWAADPWARGSYSFLPTGATPSDRAALLEPLWGGALWLAGEHVAERDSGYTHGAYDSGARAAKAALAVLGAPPTTSPF